MQPTLLHAGRDWEAWIKPAGMSVHNESPSLLQHLKQRDARREPHFVNRLDRETSGLVIVAFAAQTVERLQRVWAHPETRKIYVGLHRKRRTPAVAGPEIWDESLSDRAEGRKNPRGLVADRVPAVTHMHPLHVGDHTVLSALTIATGRQHQIRRHACLHQMELVGDSRYGDPTYNKQLKNHMPQLRLGLHAFVLHWAPDGLPQDLIAPIPDFFLTSVPDAATKARLFVENLRAKPV